MMVPYNDHKMTRHIIRILGYYASLQKNLSIFYAWKTYKLQLFYVELQAWQTRQNPSRLYKEEEIWTGVTSCYAV